MATETSVSEIQSCSVAARQAPAAATAKEDQEEISFLDLAILLARRRRMIFTLTVCCAILATIVAFVWPKEYTATVVLLPPQQGSSLSTALASQLGSLGSLAELAGGSLGIKNPNDMYVAMFRSQTVEDGMVKRFGLMREYHERLLSRARKAFEQHVTIDGTGKDGLIHISVKDRNPQRAAQLANGYVDQFRDLSQHLAISEAAQRALFFHQQLEHAKEKLTDSEEALKQMEQTTGVIELGSQARALIESAASLRAQITAKEVQIQALQTFATPENAQLVEARQELESLQNQLGELGGSRQSANSLIVPKGKVPQASLEYVRRLRNVKYYETIFEVLARQYELAKLDQAKEGALIQVVDPAIVPDYKSSPHRAVIIIVATFLGFLIGIVVAILQAGWTRMHEDPEANAKLSLLREEFRRSPRKQ